MRQKSGPEKQQAEEAIKDSGGPRVDTFSAEEKIRVVLEGLSGEESIAELCRREGIAMHAKIVKKFRFKSEVGTLAAAARIAGRIREGLASRHHHARARR
jgi:transposase-like protein